MGSDVKMIPVRNRIPDSQAILVGWHLAETLTAQWGLENATRIVDQARRWVESERKRRRKLS